MNKAIKIEKSSGNIFADLNIPNPERALTEARLLWQIIKMLQKKKLAQVQAQKKSPN